MLNKKPQNTERNTELMKVNTGATRLVTDYLYPLYIEPHPPISRKSPISVLGYAFVW